MQGINMGWITSWKLFVPKYTFGICAFEGNAGGLLEFNRAL